MWSPAHLEAELSRLFSGLQIRQLAGGLRLSLLKPVCYSSRSGKIRINSVHFTTILKTSYTFEYYESE
jgi:hypothetical protein